jgi:hypothetical protein
MEENVNLGLSVRHTKRGIPIPRRFEVRFTLNGKDYYVGQFFDIDTAREARKIAKHQAECLGCFTRKSGDQLHLVHTGTSNKITKLEHRSDGLYKAPKMTRPNGAGNWNAFNGIWNITETVVAQQVEDADALSDNEEVVVAVIEEPSNRRAQCSFCDRSFVLNKDRTMRVHQNNGSKCPGSNSTQVIESIISDGYCGVCHDGDDQEGNEILICDNCEGHYHMQCLEYPLSVVPNGEWFCSSCARKSNALVLWQDTTNPTSSNSTAESTPDDLAASDETQTPADPVSTRDDPAPGETPANPSTTSTPADTFSAQPTTEKILENQLSQLHSTRKRILELRQEKLLQINELNDKLSGLNEEEQKVETQLKRRRLSVKLCDAEAKARDAEEAVQVATNKAKDAFEQLNTLRAQMRDLE